MRMAFMFGWKNSIPLGFYTQKSLIIHRCLHKLTSVFQSQDCSNIVIKNFITYYKEDSFNEF